MIGEWVALPVLRKLDPVDAGEGDVMYETARRLLQHCDAVLRLPGESSGADKDVEIAQELDFPSTGRSTRFPQPRLRRLEA